MHYFGKLVYQMYNNLGTKSTRSMNAKNSAEMATD